MPSLYLIDVYVAVAVAGAGAGSGAMSGENRCAFVCIYIYHD